MRGVCAALTALLLSVGCVASQAEVCPDGTVCAENTHCDERPSGGFRCLDDGQLAACADKQGGDACSVGEQPGACRDGACEAFFCGDSYVTGGEVCDKDNLGVNGKN